MSENIDKSTILVPIKIEALIVDEVMETNARWKDLEVNSVAIWDLISKNSVGDVFQDKSQLLTQGIHLHWALPAALRHGIHNGSNLEYPAVPNRWIVIRTRNNNGVIENKQWIIESDYIGRGKNSWLVRDSDGYFSDTMIGKAYEFSDWNSESTAAEEPLTVMGPGNVSFAASYSSCKEVFGFHDPLTDIDNGTFSYQIAGWYSDSNLDPLHPPTESDDLWEQRIADIKSKWILSQESDPFAETTVCHANLHSLVWARNGNIGNPVLDVAVNIAMGNTAVEAISARMAKQTKAAEKVLSAFQYDLLKDASGLVEIQDQVHARQFSGNPGGSLWEIRRNETKKDVSDLETNKLSDFPDTSDGQLPGLELNFTNLNEHQRSFDDLARIKNSLQVEFRSTWDKRILDEYFYSAAYQTFLTTKMDDLSAEIDSNTTSISTAQSNIDSCKNFIMALAPFTSIADIPSAYELIETQLPMFWHPNDPSILLSGPGVVPSEKYKTAEKYEIENKTGNVDCRMPVEIIYGLKLKDDGMDPNVVSIANSSIFTSKNSFSGKIKTIVEMIYAESLLFDPAWATQLAWNYYKITIPTIPIEDPRVSTLSNSIADFLNKSLDIVASSSKVKGLQNFSEEAVILTPPYSIGEKLDFFNTVGGYKWQQAWTPLFLLWDIAWYPDYSPIGGNGKFNSSNWLFTDSCDYKKIGGFASPDLTNNVFFSGKTILSDSTSRDLKRRLEGLNTIGDLNFLSQALDGLNDALLMKNQSIQFPTLEYDDNNELILADRYDPYLNTSHYFIPDVNTTACFYPIRAGHIQINQLWVADTFGQLQRIVINDEGVISQNGNQDITSELANNGNSFITLPPRIVQPSRLAFHWVAGSNGMNNQRTDSNPITSPVCGWILPSHLDRNLMVFDANGQILGILGADLSGDLQWSGFAGKMDTPNVDTDITNSEMKGFIKGILDSVGQSQTLNQFLKLIDDVSYTIDTAGGQQDPSMAVLAGQPLALVRGSLQLELEGLPAFPQGWQQGWTDASTQQQTTGLDGCVFSASLGDMRKYKDGLVGYFSNNDYSQLSPCFGCKVPTDNYFESKVIDLSFDDISPTFVSYLIDPRAGINASTGILPTEYIELPSNLIQNALDAMEMNFLVAPFLGDLDNLTIPLANVPNKEWSWINKDESGSWRDPETAVANSSSSAKNNFLPQRIFEGYLRLKNKDKQES